MLILRIKEGNAIPVSDTTAAISDKQVTIKKDSTYFETNSSDGITTYGAQTADIFEGYTFPHAGVYAYKVTEDKGGETVTDIKEVGDSKWKETNRYSAAEYMMYVYVKNKADGSGTYVANVGIEMTKGDGIPGTERTPGTPGEDGSVQVTPGKVSGFRFTNSYSKIKTDGGDPDDPDNPVDPENPVTHTITLSKKVVGDYGDMTKYFAFNVNLAKIKTAESKVFYAYVLDKDNKVVTSTDNFAQIKNDANGKAYIEINPSTDTTVNLKHGQKLAFTNAEVGTKYTFIEPKADNYKPSATVLVNGVSNNVAQQDVNTDITANNGSKAGEAENSTEVTNTYIDITPTGLILNNLPYLLVILAGIVLAFVVRTMRRRTRETV